jgi:hypothetical protein
VETLDENGTYEELTPLEESSVKKAYPLEKAVRICLRNLEDDHKFEFKDLTNKRNFKNNKGEHVPDFYVFNHAVIEVKNWKNHYEYSCSNIKIGVTDRFAKYPNNIRRILVISHTRWSNKVAELLFKNGVYIIEVGFFVTMDNWLEAYLIILPRITEIILQKTL